jgi:HipA-like protein
VPDPYPVVDVSGWPTDAEEQMGSKEKVWLETPGGVLPKASYLFKFLRLDRNGRAYGDDWAEKVAAELAHALGMPGASVELASGMSRPGVICRRLNDPEQVELAHGNELLGAREPSYDTTLKREHPLYTVEAVRGCLREVAPPTGAIAVSDLDGFGVWAGYLVLDALIANTDRHHENWGALIDRATGHRALAPSFDHGSSLGFNVRPDRVVELADGRRSIEQWCTHGRSKHLPGRPGLVAVARTALESSGARARDHWLDRIHDLRAEQMMTILRRVPDDRMSDGVRIFVGKLLETNRRRLLDVRD